MRVLIATVKVPFIYGGAEVLADNLLIALKARGHEADIVAIPYKHYPPERILDHMLACRLFDLTEAFGNSIDRLIALKFPAYFVRHPNKVLWLLHQHRQAYDLWDHPEAGDLLQVPNGHVIRDTIRHADRTLLPEAKAIYTLSSNVSRRLQEGCAIDSEPLYNPPSSPGSFYCADGQDYLYYPSRVNRSKRQSLVLRALALTRRPVSVLFSGAADNAALQRECDDLIRDLGLEGRARFLGHVTEDEKIRLYAESRGVIFTPLDEDYGYITLEAMLSQKPVITCTDAGGPLEFVVPGETGLVAAPAAESLAEAMDELWLDRERAAQLGRSGRKRYEELDISWDNVVDHLLA